MEDTWPIVELGPNFEMLELGLRLSPCFRPWLLSSPTLWDCPFTKGGIKFGTAFTVLVMGGEIPKSFSS